MLILETVMITLLIYLLMTFAAFAQTPVDCGGGAGCQVKGSVSVTGTVAIGATVPGGAPSSSLAAAGILYGLQGLQSGDGTASSYIALPELSAGGHGTDSRIYGADSQATSGCIIWPAGTPSAGQVAADSGSTATTSDGKTCRVFTWQAQVLPSLVCTGTPPVCTLQDTTLVTGATSLLVKAGATQSTYQTAALQKWYGTDGKVYAAMAPGGGLFVGRGGNFIDSPPNYASDGMMTLTDKLNFLVGTNHLIEVGSAGGSLSVGLWNGSANLVPVTYTDQGYRQDGGALPAVATGAGDCGTSPAVEAGSNSTSGRITVGSSTNGGICTVTFANTAPTAHFPACVVQDETSNQHIRSVPTSNKIAVFTGTLTAGDLLSYQCAWH